MSALLQRLHAVFDGMPIILAPLTTAARPSAPSLQALADHVAALANNNNGGVFVLGIDAHHPHRVRGVAEPQRWVAALHHIAANLVPPFELEVEVGEEEGLAIVVAHVPNVYVRHDLVRRIDGPPVRLVGGRPVPRFRPLEALPGRTVSPMLAPVDGSNLTWLDPEATRNLAPGAPAAWDRATRAGLVRDGLLAADGIALTRTGLLLAGLPEHREDEHGVVLELPTGVFGVTRGWILLREDLRAEARQAGVRQADLVADLVMDVLVRTAGPTASGPVIVDLTPELLTIEAPSPMRDDSDLLARMKRWAGWRPERWQAPAVGWHLPVTWEREGAGIRVVAHLIRPERPVAPLRPRKEARGVRAAPDKAGAQAPVPCAPSSTSPAPQPLVATEEAMQPRKTREAAVLSLLADGHAWTRRDLDARLGWSRSTLRTVLEGLVDAGRVRADAASPRSPFQAYRAA